MKIEKIFGILFIFTALLAISACNPGTSVKTETSQKDSLNTEKANDKKVSDIEDSTSTKSTEKDKNNPAANLPIVLIYNFHVTNRCVSCIAIEDATTKTLNTFFASEMKQGRVKRKILNVDDEANKKISEKYEAYGSGLFVTQVFKGKETTTDFTGDGFKYAKNKQEKFIELLKTKISEYLK
jgi:hypothetical protein